MIESVAFKMKERIKTLISILYDHQDEIGEIDDIVTLLWIHSMLKDILKTILKNTLKTNCERSINEEVNTQNGQT